MAITYRVVTANLQAHLSLFRVARSVRKILRKGHRPHLLAFQEIGGRRKWATIRVALGRHYAGARLPHEAAEVPVAWLRGRFRLEHKFKWHLSDPTPVGRHGPGPRVLRGKAATVVVLWDKQTHGHVVLFNSHLAPSPYMNHARGRLHKSQVDREAALVAWVDDHFPGAEIFDVGDKNARRRSRLRPLVRAGLRIGRDIATHGPHAYDRIMSTMRHRGMRAIPTDSDHDALFGRF